MLNGENIEIEAKFGQFQVKGESKKFPYPDLEHNLFPLVYNPQPNYHFSSGMPKQHFEHLRDKVFNGRCENYKRFQYALEIKLMMRVDIQL